MAPPVSRAPVEMPNPTLEDKRLALWTKVQSLLNMGAIEKVDPATLGGGGVYSHYFLVTKKTGGFHPIQPHMFESLPPRREVQDGDLDFLSQRSSSGHVDDFH